MTYTDLFGPITAEDAERDSNSLFSSTSPKMTIQTTLEIDGLTLNITISDTTIAEAVRLLKQRRTPTPRPAKRRRHRHPTQPTFDLVWSDFADEPSEQGARVIQLAQALDHPHWSTALAVAAETCKTNLR